MTDDDHRKLAQVLHSVKGKVALSGYHCDLLDELYSDWKFIQASAKKVHSVKTERTEVLWINYRVEEINQPLKEAFLAMRRAAESSE
jgi:DNA adenine methylase